MLNSSRRESKAPSMENITKQQLAV